MSARCHSCKAEIEWARTAAGKHMPLELAAEGGNVLLDRDLFGEVTAMRFVPRGDGTHLPHWARCPQAAEWRAMQARKERA